MVLMCCLQANSSLVTLRLPHNAIGDSGAVALASMLRYNGALRSLDLAYNRITDQGCTALLKAARHSGLITVRTFALVSCRCALHSFRCMTAWCCAGADCEGQSKDQRGAPQ